MSLRRKSQYFLNYALHNTCSVVEHGAFGAAFDINIKPLRHQNIDASPMIMRIEPYQIRYHVVNDETVDTSGIG